jgi:ABC-type transport system involved in multi-copper enzyme maturation permease subunit
VVSWGAPGPVFVYEWLAASRRWQVYALRTLFLTSFLVALTVVWSSNQAASSIASSASTIRSMALLGEWFFVAVIGTQLTLVLLAAPAATAGAICQDRARGTLTHMLMTDLTNREIVVGKLAARLAPILSLIACTLPVLALLTLLGGVDPGALLGAFAVTLGLALLGSSLALAFSLWAGKTHDALLGTYAVWGLWLLARPMIGELGRAFAWNLPLPSQATDPYRLAFAPYWSPGSVSWAHYAWFLGTTSALSVLLVGVAVVRIRSICTRDVVARRPSRILSRVGMGRLDPRRFLPGPRLDLNPVLWREWHRTRPTRLGRIVITLYVGLAGVFSFGVIVTKSPDVAAWVNGFQVFAGLLIVSVTAATTLADERVRGSLDVLMTTPISTGQIVWGKWLGTFRMVPALAFLPALVALGGVWMDTKMWPIVGLIILYILCAGAVVTSFGLVMAMRCPRLGRAVALTVTIYALIGVGWLFAALMLFGPHGEGIAMASPFVWSAVVTSELIHWHLGMRNLGWGILWTFVCGGSAIALLVIILSNFDRLMGRVEDGPARLCHGTRSRSQRVASAIYVGWVALTLIAAILTLPGSGPVVNGILICGGLLLVSVQAALSMAEDRGNGALEHARGGGFSSFQIALAKWLGSGRFVLLLAFLTPLVVLCRREPEFAAWQGMVLMTAYVISAGGAFAALGLALGARFPRGRAVMLSVALGTAFSLGWVISSRSFPPGADSIWLWMGSPFVGVAVVTGELMGIRSPGIYNLYWLILWIAGHALVAAGLLAATSTILQRGAAEPSGDSRLLRLASRPSG